MTSDFAARSRQFQDALFEALSLSPDDAVVVDSLGQLVGRARGVAGDHPHIGEALDALDAVASRTDIESGLSEAAALFASPQLFREALYFVRCLDRDPVTALELMEARGYVAGAVVPVATNSGLATQQAAVLDATTFAALWREPARLREMIDGIDAWRRSYTPAYRAAHAAYNETVGTITETTDAQQIRVEAIEKLNRVSRLGPPLMEIELLKFHEMEGLYACPANAEHLAEALLTDPICVLCGVRLGDVPPMGEAERVAHEIERGLEMHRLRLAQHVVPRLVTGGRGGEHIDRFKQAVQSDDDEALVKVLDDGFLGFLDDLLDTPEPRVNLIERLAKLHPEVTPENLDAVVDSFRRIAADEVQRGGGRVRIGVEENPA